MAYLTAMLAVTMLKAADSVAATAVMATASAAAITETGGVGFVDLIVGNGGGDHGDCDRLEVMITVTGASPAVMTLLSARVAVTTVMAEGLVVMTALMASGW